MLSETSASRTLKLSAWSALCALVLLFSANRPSWAWGFLIGSGLSLFSLFSLIVVVPMLMIPHAPRYAKNILALTLFMKLPLYAIGLYAATHVRGIEVIGAGIGIIWGPTIITLKTIGDALAEGRAATVAAPNVAKVPARRSARLAPPLPVEPVRERG